MILIEDLINRIDIVEYIGQYVDLTKDRDEWWGLSPFTNEVHASFSVNQEKQIYYDFSSGHGGTVYEFIRRYHKYSPSRTYQEMIRYCNLDENEINSYQRLDINRICKKYSSRDRNESKKGNSKKLPYYCMDNYTDSSEALQPWIEEGISAETLKRFSVRFDNFQNRLVFPIRNINGDIVNISGRTLDPDFKNKEIRKYTYYTKWGEKGNMSVIYGLFENYQEIMNKKEVILFEGAKSVMKCHTWGIYNVGAILTSHLSEAQFRILIKLGVNVVFALDKEINPRKDEKIQKLKNYCNVSYICDRWNLLDKKDAPVDKGTQVFEKLYEHRIQMR